MFSTICVQDKRVIASINISEVMSQMCRNMGTITKAAPLKFRMILKPRLNLSSH